MPLIPIPSIEQLKSVYDGILQAIGFVKKVQEKFEVKVTGSSERILWIPGKDDLVEKILNGKFPRIPGVYRVIINNDERLIEVTTVSQDSFDVSWKFRDKYEMIWWALPESSINEMQWIELVEVTYN